MHLEEDNQDGFDDAFSQFANPEAGKPVDDESADGGDDDADADEGDAGDDGADGDGAGGDDTGDDTGGDDADGAADSGADDDAGDDDEGDDDAEDEEPPVDRTDALIESLTKLLDKKDEPASKQEQQPADGEALYTAEEQEFLKTYDEDWGDVTRGEALKRRAEYQELLKHVFTEVARVFAPVQETVQTLATRTHLQDIESSVPDYEQLRDGVIAWVEQQPAYLQQGMKQVIQSGTADEVADLIGRYREATGAPPKAAPKQTKQADLPEPAKKAAAALAPVSTKRSSIPQQDDPNDFDAAFKRFAGGR